MGVKPINNVPVKSTPEVERPVAAANVTNIAEKNEASKTVKITREDAKNVAEVMNQVTQLFNSQLHFEVFEKTDQLYVQIVDKDTKEVIKQIPPKEMLELEAKIQEMVGLILDKYA